MNKYRNIPKRVDGILFQSTKEARRFTELKLMQEAGVIRELELQPRFKLEANGEFICHYIGDFAYFDNERQAQITEDVKGMRTETYKLKKRLMKALLAIEIEEP